MIDSNINSKNLQTDYADRWKKIARENALLDYISFNLSLDAILLSKVVGLRPDQLPRSRHYPHGVYQILFQNEKPILGISFQGLSLKDNPSPFIWSVARKHHKEAPTLKGKGCKWSSSISCLYPTIPATFVPIRVSDSELKMFEIFLELANLVEDISRCDSNQREALVRDLNVYYDRFVTEYGLIHNYTSYFENQFWTDIRLSTLLLNLETITYNDDLIYYKKSWLFNEIEPIRPQLKTFSHPDLSIRIEQAYHWSISYYGKLDPEAIALATKLDVATVETYLLDLELVYRDFSRES